MGDLTANFSKAEWTCHDGTPVPPECADNVLKCARNLQVLRDELGLPVHVISGYRSPAYNKKIGGADHSFHMTGHAADIQVPGMTPKQVHAKVLELIVAGKMHNGGVGVYPTFVHVDVRSAPARWVG
jgi:uncharacterized protein YcbK (DUF882 family)